MGTYPQEVEPEVDFEENDYEPGQHEEVDNATPIDPRFCPVDVIPDFDPANYPPGAVPKVIFITRFNWTTTTERSIRELLEPFGPLVSVHLKQKSAFIEFLNPEDAHIAKHTLHCRAGLGSDSLIVDFKQSNKANGRGRDSHDRRDFRDSDRNRDLRDRSHHHLDGDRHRNHLRDRERERSRDLERSRDRMRDPRERDRDYFRGNSARRDHSRDSREPHRRRPPPSIFPPRDFPRDFYEDHYPRRLSPPEYDHEPYHHPAMHPYDYPPPPHHHLGPPPRDIPPPYRNSRGHSRDRYPPASVSSSSAGPYPRENNKNNSHPDFARSSSSSSHRPGGGGGGDGDRFNYPPRHADNRYFRRSSSPPPAANRDGRASSHYYPNYESYGGPGAGDRMNHSHNSSKNSNSVGHKRSHDQSSEPTLSRYGPSSSSNNTSGVAPLTIAPGLDFPPQFSFSSQHNHQQRSQQQHQQPPPYKRHKY